jgi:hypothetical protein
MKFCPCFLHVRPNRIKFDTENLHVTILGIYVIFVKNRRTETHTLVKGVNGFVSVLYTSIVRFGRNSV